MFLFVYPLLRWKEIDDSGFILFVNLILISSVTFEFIFTVLKLFAIFPFAFLKSKYHPFTVYQWLSLNIMAFFTITGKVF